MGLFWKAPINKTVHLLEASGKRELFWYGITIGQIGFGVLASVERQPTKDAVDLPFGAGAKYERCPECGTPLRVVYDPKSANH